MAKCCTCCDNVLALGCLSSCATLITNIEAPEDGEYCLELGYLSSSITIKTNALQGEALTFDISTLNESYIFKGKLIFDNKELILADDDNNQYDCIQFETYLNDCISNRPVGMYTVVS